MYKSELNLLNKNWVETSFCVIQNLKNFNFTVTSGKRGFVKTNIKVLFKSDNLDECNKFKDNFTDLEDDVLIGYTCIFCHNTQQTSKSCERCGSEQIEPKFE